MEKLKFSSEILGQYARMHELVVKAKYYFLKTVQFATLDDNSKDELRTRLIGISNEIGNHYRKIKYSKITSYNLDEYEKVEAAYLRKIRKEIELFLKLCRKHAPVSMDYSRNMVEEHRIDEDILDSTIYGTRALELDKLRNLNGFYDYLIQNAVEEKEKKIGKQVLQSVDADLMELKISNFIEMLGSERAVNPDIYYKVKTKMERLFSDGTKINIIRKEDSSEPDMLNADELYLIYDNSYNIHLMYSTVNMVLELNARIIDSIVDNRIIFTRGIEVLTRAGADEAGAGLFLSEKERSCPIEKFSDVFNRILDEFELRTIYDQAAELIRLNIEFEKNRELKVQQQSRENVSRKLDALLS